MPTEVLSDQLARGLRHYVARIADGFAVGTGASYCETAEFATAYIALPERAAGWPDHDAALLWDQRHGWALAIERFPGAALEVVAYQGNTLVPTPSAVLAFARRVLTHGPGRQATEVAAGELDISGLAERLAAYAEPELLSAPTGQAATPVAGPPGHAGAPRCTVAARTGTKTRPWMH